MSVTLNISIVSNFYYVLMGAFLWQIYINELFRIPQKL